MVDDQVRGEFRFDLTGNGIKKLESLAALLQTVNKISLVSVRRTNSISAALNKEAVAIRSATAAYRVYTNQINRAAKAHLDLKKAASGTTKTPTTTGTTATTASTGTTSTGKTAASSAELEAQRALNKEIEQGIKDADKLNREYYAKQKRDAAESARIQRQLSSGATAHLRAEDAKRTASSKAASAAQERAAQMASAETIKQAELISRQRTAQLQAETKANLARVRADQQWAAGLSNTRYALYDVSRTATMAAVAMGASVAVPIYMAAKYEKAFASVARTVGTTGAATAELRKEFENLSTTIPESFESLATIGTLAGQLDIPAASVAKFTEVVAQFSATTNVGVEEAATNLGRVAQLTNTAADQYENLGSAIYKVGVTSVATESEILDMASQIATAGDLAGFSNTQIIALSGALASLGIQPEAARGSLQRIFNIIENGATTSTAATAKLAETTGMTLDEMKRLWKSGDEGSQQVFSAFVSGLERMQAAGENTTNFLKDMGVNAVRDQRLLQVLANNTEVYAQALTNSSDAYADGTSLADAYAQQTDNVADNFTRLINTLTAFISELGQSDGTLSAVIKGITEVAKTWLELSRNPLVSFLTKAIGTLLVMGTGIALTVAVTSKMRAAMYGLVTSSIGVKATSDSLTRSFGALSAELAITTKQFLTGTLTAQTFGTTIGRVAQSTDATTASLSRNAAATTAAGTASSAAARNVLAGIGSFVKFNAIILGVTAGLWLLNEAWVKYTETDLDKAHKVFGDSASGLVEALKADAAEYKTSGEAIRVYTVGVQDSAEAIPAWKTQLEAARQGQSQLGVAVDDTTKQIERQNQIIIGESTAQEFRNMVAGADSVKTAWQEYGQVLTETGFDLTAWFEQVGTSADHGLGALQTKLEAAQKEAYNLALKENVTPEDANRISTLTNQIAAYQGLIDAVKLLDPALKEATTSQQLLTAANNASASQADATKEAINGLGDETTTMASEFQTLRDSIMAPYEAADSWRQLGESLAENGKEFDGLGEKAQSNVDAVLNVLDQLQQASGEDTNKFGEGILSTMIALQEQGVNTGGSLSFLGDMLNQTLGGTYNLDFNSSAAQSNIIGVIDSAIAAQQSIMALQAAALGAAESALQAGYSVANASALFAAQAAYNAAAAKASTLEALRALAVKASAAAQKNLTSGLNTGTKAANKNTNATNKNASANKKAARTLSDWVDDLESVMDAADDFRWGVSDAWDEVVAAQEAAVAQLVETVWNIQSAYENAFREIEYQDALSTALYNMQEKAQDAADAVIDAVNKIKDAQADLAGIQSDRTNLEYGLNVAVLYGDTLRAESIRAEIAKLDADKATTTQELTEAQRELSDAYAAQDKSLTGNSEQAIENRQTVKDLVSTYSDYIQTLVDSGASTEEVAAAVKQAQTDFMAQAKAMGFSGSELKKYSDLFNAFAGTTTSTAQSGEDAVRDLYEAWEDYILKLIESGASQKEINQAIADGKAAVEKLAKEMGLAPAEIQKFKDAFNGIDKIVDKIPKNITVKFDADMDPADRAIKEWRAKNTGGDGASKKITVPVDVAYSGGKSSERQHAEEMMAKYAKLIMGTTNMAALTSYSKSWTSWQRKALASLSSGGFTGKGGKYEEAGIVHKGEYVIPKQDVNQSTGKPYIMEKVSNTTNNNSVARMPSVIMVELSPVDRALLRASGGDLIVQIDGKQVAAAVNSANKSSSVRGSS